MLFINRSFVSLEKKGMKKELERNFKNARRCEEYEILARTI